MSLESTTPALRPAPGRENPLPEYVSTTDRNALPNVLDWASESPRPPINGRVDVVRFGIALGTGTAVGYFHRGGELGVLVELDSVPSFLDLPEGTSTAHFFGENLRRLDQGDEPDETADNANVLDVPVYKAGVDQEAAKAVSDAGPEQQDAAQGEVANAGAEDAEAEEMGEEKEEPNEGQIVVSDDDDKLPL
ncbi:hypothetical protein [Hymenobacter sp. YC55]|uniref:hypothetical protein n=1 Tax=Hymenobacter sp. YC55 TaxID=3034019 RepID=UPI0023F8C72B|nr:hypothetical protein [Hymenobacter sp. YC55]MDF7815272.1 hypothetical protein [Hymenobacter sp. YC55]